MFTSFALSLHASLAMLFVTWSIVLSNWTNLTTFSFNCDVTIDDRFISARLRCVFSLNVSSTSYWRDVRFPWHAFRSVNGLSFLCTWYGTNSQCFFVCFNTLDTKMCTLALSTTHLRITQIKRVKIDTLAFTKHFSWHVCSSQYRTFTHLQRQFAHMIAFFLTYLDKCYDITFYYNYLCSSDPDACYVTCFVHSLMTKTRRLTGFDW
jgi:hypothetical protein